MPIFISMEYDAPGVKRIQPFFLPVAPEELRQRLDRLGFTLEATDDIRVIANLNDDILPSTKSVLTIDDDYMSVLHMDELNYLACLYDQLDDGGKEKFKAVMEYIKHGYSQFPHEVGSIGDTTDILLNLDKFIFHPDVQTVTQLGMRVFNNDMPNAPLDELPPNRFYREYGQEALQRDMGCFTAHGYVGGGGKGFEPYSLYGEVPEEYRVWEKAFAELPPFENPIHIDYESLSLSHVDEWQFLLANEIFELFVATDTIRDGDHKHRGQRIVEIAATLSSDTESPVDTLTRIAMNGGMYAGEAVELIDRIANPDGEYNTQWQFERGGGVDPDYEVHYAEELAKLPPDLRYDENIKLLLENRTRHQKALDQMERMEPPLNALTPEQVARFQMLPSDKQTNIQLEQDTFIEYIRVKEDNARAMIDLYSDKINKYLDNHIKHGPYDPEKIARATAIKESLAPRLAAEYDCDPNQQPVVKIEAHGCELFPVGKEYPFPVFNEMFNDAVAYYGALQDAGVPLSQNLVYLNMAMVMEDEPVRIKFHTDKSVLLFVDQGKTFLEQIAAADSLEPVFREKLTAYLTMHLGVEAQFHQDMREQLEKTGAQYREQLLTGGIQPLGRYDPPPSSLDSMEAPYLFALQMCERVNQKTDYVLFSEPWDRGSLPEIGRRFEALIETIDPSGHERQGFITAAHVAESLRNGDKAQVADFLLVLGNVDGIYSDVARELAASIEQAARQRAVVKPVPVGQRPDTGRKKPSIHASLQKMKDAAQQPRQPGNQRRRKNDPAR